MSIKEILTKQKTLPLIGEIQQLIGGSMLWVGGFTLIFSGIAAWNTNTMVEIRRMFPVLNNIFVFGGIVLCVMILGLWLQHKYVQPSILAYFNKMQYMSNPLNKDVADNQKKILEVKAILLRVENRLKREDTK